MSSENRAKEEAGKIDDGGPAFPSEVGGKTPPDQRSGMSLRDWFAGQAMAGLLARNSVLPHAWYCEMTESRGHTAAIPDSHVFIVSKDAWATGAYAIADAMLSARKTGVSP